jgi:hypothetical protein
MDEGRKREWSPDGIVWGVALIAGGVLWALDNQGLLPGGLWRGWWVYVVMLIGVSQITVARTASAVGDGVSTTLIGVWLAANVYGWYGLTWGSSWPLVFVAIGAGLVTRALAGLFMPDRRRG